MHGEINVVSLIVSTLRMTAPLFIGAMGGLIAAKSGMMAMGLESMMLSGAFGAVFFSYTTGNVALSFLFGALCGCLVGLAFGFFSIRCRVNQVICGIGLNLFVLGGTTVLMQFVWKNSGNSPGVPSLTDPVHLPWLRAIPFVGDIFNSMSINFYISLLVVVLTWYLLYRTAFGLRLRMVGENPTAAGTLGIPVRGYKYAAMALCGLLGGYAGAFLSLDHLNLFAKDMVAGRGYIILVILALGKYFPFGVAMAALLFGFADSLQMNLQQVMDVPTKLIQMFPYVTTLLVLTFGVKHVKGPEGMGKLPEE
jgi:ABC-type uncharacterized transport system permease subunit